jgi:hypothetical protein
MWACVRNSLTKNYSSVYNDVRVVAFNARQLLYEGVVSRAESKSYCSTTARRKSVLSLNNLKASKLSDVMTRIYVAMS